MDITSASVSGACLTGESRYRYWITPTQPLHRQRHSTTRGQTLKSTSCVLTTVGCNSHEPDKLTAKEVKTRVWMKVKLKDD